MNAFYYLFGVAWMLVIFYPFLRGVDYFMQQSYDSISILTTNLSNEDFEQIKQEYPIALAIFHTSFNIANTLLLIGFAPFIAKVATSMVRGDDDDEEEFRLKFIGTGLVSTSEIAILQAKKEVANFGLKVRRMFDFLTELLNKTPDKEYLKLIKRIAKYEEITDNIEVEVATFLASVSDGDVSHESSKEIRAMLKIIDDMQSAADVIFQMSKTIDNNVRKKIRLTNNQLKAITDMSVMVNEAISEMVLNLNRPYQSINPAKAAELEEQINARRDQLRHKHIDDLKEKKYKHRVGAFYSDLFSMMEKVGDYVINVSEALQEISDRD